MTESPNAAGNKYTRAGFSENDAKFQTLYLIIFLLLIIIFIMFR